VWEAEIEGIIEGYRDPPSPLHLLSYYYGIHHNNLLSHISLLLDTPHLILTFLSMACSSFLSKLNNRLVRSAGSLLISNIYITRQLHAEIKQAGAEIRVEVKELKAETTNAGAEAKNFKVELKELKAETTNTGAEAKKTGAEAKKLKVEFKELKADMKEVFRGQEETIRRFNDVVTRGMAGCEHDPKWSQKVLETLSK
jgi:hypothetical protein